MRWRGRRQSSNVQDRRSGGFGRRGIPLGIGRSRLGRRSGIGGLGLLAVIVIALLLGVDLGLMLTGGQDPINSMPGTKPAQPSSADDKLRDFGAVVLDDIEDVWNAVFPERLGQPDTETETELYARGVEPAWGVAG